MSRKVPKLQQTSRGGPGRESELDASDSARKLTLVERIIEKTTFQVDLAKVIFAVAILIFAIKAPDAIEGLARLVRLLSS
jgi:hypothetical protein